MAPLESDQSGLWGFAEGATPDGVAFSYSCSQECCSFWKIKAVNSGGLGAEPPIKCFYLYDFDLQSPKGQPRDYFKVLRTFDAMSCGNIIVRKTSMVLTFMLCTPCLCDVVANLSNGNILQLLVTK